MSELELFYTLSLTEDGQKMQIPLSSAEHRGRGYESRVGEWIHDRGYEPGDELQKLLNARMLPTAQEARSAKLSLLLLAGLTGTNCRLWKIAVNAMPAPSSA